MKDFSPIDSTLKWIELYRKGSYSLGKFQTRVKWLIEAVRIEKEQMEASVNPDALSESEAKTHQEFVQIMGLMLDALEKTDLHLREGEDELLKKSLVTIHDVHNKLHDLKDSMIQTFSKEELQKS
jgi:soluble cytochrome b562